MVSLRFFAGWTLGLALVVATLQLVDAVPKLSFTHVWTYSHETPGQLSEIPAFDPATNTIWVAGVVGVDVIDAETGATVDHIDVTAHGAVNSVAIHDGLAALAVEAPSGCLGCDRRNPGKVLFYDTNTLLPSGPITAVTVGSLPDMLTFTHDGSKLLVVNEATPNVSADTTYVLPDPAGSVSVIDMATRTVVATADFDNVPTSGSFLRLPINTGMDYEPEYIAVNEDDTKAFVTVQEANAIAVLDLTANGYPFTQIIGLGAKDFSAKGNEIDPKNDGSVSFMSVAAKGLYMPDAVATYVREGVTYLVMANEGDFREDNADRTSTGAAAPLDALRVVRDLKSQGLFAAGARSFSIRRTDGSLVWDSGSILDEQAHARGIYDDSRSRDKGVEPEGVALLRIGERTYAFIGLERPTKAAVAIFDISNPKNAKFVDMIVTTGDLSPEGLAAFRSGGNYYLAIANEVVATAAGATTTHTTLYRIQPADEDDGDE